MADARSSELHSIPTITNTKALGVSVLDIYQDGNVLVTYLDRLSEARRIRLIESLGSSLKRIIKDGHQLARCLRRLPVANRMMLIDALGEDVSGIVEDGEQFAECLGLLSEVDQVIFITKFGKGLKKKFANGHQLAACLKVSPLANQIKLLDALGDVSDLFEDGAQLGDCLRRMHETLWGKFIGDLGDGIYKILSDGQLVSCLARLRAWTRIKFLKILGKRACEMVKDGNQLSRCLNVLAEDDRMPFIYELGDDARKIIATGRQLAECIYRFSQASHREFIDFLGDHIKGLLADGLYLDWFWRGLLEENRIILIERYPLEMGRLKLSPKKVALLPHRSQHLLALSEEVHAKNITPSSNEAYRYIGDCLIDYSGARMGNTLLAGAYRFFAGAKHQHCGDLLAKLLLKSAYAKLNKDNAKDFFAEFKARIQAPIYEDDLVGAILIMTKALLGIDFHANANPSMAATSSKTFGKSMSDEKSS